MDFIERLFYISPDHGDGTLEAIIVVVVLALPFVLFFLREYKRVLSSSVNRAKLDDTFN
jgi:hypothetical protein